MPCSICGDICECAAEAGLTAPPRLGPDSDVRFATTSRASLSTQTNSNSNPAIKFDADSPGKGGESNSDDSSTWRREVAARLNRYQSRRKPRAPRYPSLRLRFEGEDATRGTATSVSQMPASNHALALQEFSSTESASLAAARSYSADEPAEGPSVLARNASLTPAPTTATAKIIEFPRSWTPPPPRPDELADPVVDRPRILDVPDVIPSPPALGGITIEPAQQPELEKRPGIDFPLRTAAIERRVLSAIIDGLVIASAGGVFAFIFWKLTGICPPPVTIVAAAAGLGFLLWTVYQYILVVYAGTTPGLRLAGLELLRFDEARPSRRLRRWRVLASFLSSVSLCMGYLWVFLDEDSLCWHDRITRTYLAPRNLKSASDK